MKSVYTIIFAAVVSVFLISCSGVRVSQDFDKSFAFDDVRTFGWNSSLQSLYNDSPENNELLDQRFKSAIEVNLGQKGFQLNAHPDILVSYQYTVSSRITSRPITTGVGFSTGRYDRYSGIDIYNSNSIEEYDLGKLEIHFHSTVSGRLIWLGTGTRQVYTHTDPEQLTLSVNELVHNILNQFPPGNSN